MSELETIEIGEPFGKPIKQFEEPIKEETFLEKAMPYFFVLGFLLMIFAVSLTFVNEFYIPNQFCNSVNLEHNIIFFPLPPTHFCGDSKIEHYSDGWDYPRPEFISNPF